MGITSIVLAVAFLRVLQSISLVRSAYTTLENNSVQLIATSAGSMTAEVVSNSSNLLMDIKPGYMLGAKPRQQIIGHIIGIFAGSFASVPLFFLLFTSGVDRTSPESVKETIGYI